MSKTNNVLKLGLHYFRIKDKFPGIDFQTAFPLGFMTGRSGHGFSGPLRNDILYGPVAVIEKVLRHRGYRESGLGSLGRGGRNILFRSFRSMDYCRERFVKNATVGRFLSLIHFPFELFPETADLAGSTLLPGLDQDLLYCLGDNRNNE